MYFLFVAVLFMNVLDKGTEFAVHWRRCSVKAKLVVKGQANSHLSVKPNFCCRVGSREVRPNGQLLGVMTSLIVTSVAAT